MVPSRVIEFHVWEDAFSSNFDSFLFSSRDFIIDENDLNSFTIFLKTMVTFTLFNKNLFVWKLSFLKKKRQCGDFQTKYSREDQFRLSIRWYTCYRRVSDPSFRLYPRSIRQPQSKSSPPAGNSRHRSFLGERQTSASKGGLIEIQQNWDCNFDLRPNKCVPTYKFNLLQSGDDAQSPGVNYR